LEKAEMGRKLARAMEDVEALKHEMKTAASRKETSDLKKAEMEEKLARAMKKMARKK
jgi:hypothetical protein